jgi:acyl carrier protein
MSPQQDKIPTRDALLKLIFEILSLTGSFTEAESQSLVELGVDSLALVELSIALEEQYEIRLDIKELKSSSTIRELLDQLERAEG